MDLSIHLHIVLRALKHVTVPIQLFRIQAPEIFPLQSQMKNGPKIISWIFWSSP